MKSHHHQLFFGLFFLFCSQSLAQNYQQKELDLNSFLEQTFSARSEAINVDALFENFYQLYRNPLDLNQVDGDDLATLYVLSPNQIQDFIKYRNEFGYFLSIYELQAIPGFDLETIYKVLPFVSIGNTAATWKEIASKKPSNHYLLLRTDRTLETQKGYTPPSIYQGKPTQRYLGDAQRTFFRYRLSDSKNYSFGITAETDAGEQFTWKAEKKQYGFDFISFHAQIKNQGNLKNLVLGDYQLQIGQGLVLSSGFYLGKSSETIYSVRRSNLGIRPYTSTVEGDFFRGFAGTYQIGKFDLTGFYSGLKRDANVNESGVVTSLLTSGLHRTTAELADKASLKEQNMGFHVFRKWSSGNAGFSFLNTQFELPLLKRNLAYNKYEFQGKNNQTFGLHFNQYIQNWNLFGEIAHSKSGGIGAVVGLMAALDKKTEISAVFRNYDKNFHSFYSNSFGENSRNINEKGFYVGLKYQAFKTISLSAYFDYFQFPWLRYLVDEPTKGKGYLLRTTYRPSKKLNAFAQYSFEQNAKNLTINKIKSVTENYRNNFLINLDYTTSQKITFRSRIYWNNFGFKNQPKTNGFAILQDIDSNWKQLSITGRVAYFNTDDYDTRIYAYERDVLYAASFPFYMNQGWRKYFILQYPVSQKMDLWLRISRTNYNNQTKVGSDLDEILYPHKTDARLQVRYKL